MLLVRVFRIDRIDSSQEFVSDPAGQLDRESCRLGMTGMAGNGRHYGCRRQAGKLEHTATAVGVFPNSYPGLWATNRSTNPASRPLTTDN
jgi:hypothetical protein